MIHTHEQTITRLFKYYLSYRMLVQEATKDHWDGLRV